MPSSYFSTYFSQDLEELYIFQEIPDRNCCKKHRSHFTPAGGHREPHTLCVGLLWSHLLGVSPCSLWSSHPGLCRPQVHRLVLLSLWNTLSLTPWSSPFRRDRLTFADHVNKVTQPRLFLSPPCLLFLHSTDHLSDTTLGWSWGAKIAGVPAPSLCLSDTRGSVNICWVRERDSWQSYREQMGLVTETSEEALIVVTLKFGDSLNQGAGVEKRVRRQGG